MKKCVKLLFEVDNAQNVLETFIAKQAEIFGIEGIGQKIKDSFIQLYVCGQQDRVDDFIDTLYLGDNDIRLENIKIETCPTDRSYRGVFRIVE